MCFKQAAVFIKTYKDVWNFIGIVVGIVLLLVTYGQLTVNSKAIDEQKNQYSIDNQQTQLQLNLTTKALEAQQNQYILDNRPFVYVSDVISNQTTDNLALRINMLNVGKLPAIIDEEPNVTVVIGGVSFQLHTNQSEIVLYPNQIGKGLNEGLIGSNLGTIINNAGGYELKIGFNYYAANDIERKNPFYYYSDDSIIGGVMYIHNESIK
jgi:hypothetical protein